jgi:phosphomevalonate kinase
MNMAPITATAPGKMLLLGEYSVLEGCPALSLAVNRRAVVSVEQTSGERHSLQSSILPGEVLEFSVRDDELQWSDKAAAGELGLDGLLKPWLDVLGDIHAPALDIRLDSSAFYQGDGNTNQKMGLGSSAAINVACAGVFCSLRGEKPELPSLIAAHQALQGGLGSGIDIATSLHGGLIRFQLTGLAEDPDVQRLALPPSFHFGAVWSGESASSGSMLEQFRQWTSRHADQWQMCLLAARVICEAGCRACSNSDGPALVRAIRGYGEWMKALEKASGLRIYTPAHSFLDTIATRCNCAYKPSGAGGGDIGVVAAESIERFTEFQERATAEGYQMLDLQAEQNGLEVSG